MRMGDRRKVGIESSCLRIHVVHLVCVYVHLRSIAVTSRRRFSLDGNKGLVVSCSLELFVNLLVVIEEAFE